MRILQINNYHFIKGGADRVYFNTSKLLEDNGHQVINFSSLNSANIATDYSRNFIPLTDNRQSNFIDKIKGVNSYIYNSTAYKNLEILIKENIFSY